MPVDHVYVSWNFGQSGVQRGRALLQTCGVLAESDFSTQGLLAGNGSVRLPRADKRLPVLIRSLTDAGQKPHPRFDREYTTSELDRAEFLVLRLRTVGVFGGRNFDQQQWDWSRACSECGAGSRPKSPLYVRTSELRAKKLEFTAHDHHLVAQAELARAIRGKGLSGIAAKPVRSLAGPDPRFVWLACKYSWPAVARPEFLFRERPCGTCGRAGHFDAWERPIAFAYAQLLKRAPDFGVTHEYFGEWRLGRRHPDGRRVGGGQRLIVSQRARRALRELGVSRLSFAPVFAVGDPLLADWPTAPVP
jgi:hypothetical protein